MTRQASSNQTSQKYNTCYVFTHCQEDIFLAILMVICPHLSFSVIYTYFDFNLNNISLKSNVMR